MDIVISVPQKIKEHCAKIGITEEKIEDVVVLFIDDILSLYSEEKLLDEFKKWEIERNGIL
jgi:hypothetical protein